MPALTLGALTFNGANLTAAGVAGSQVICTDLEGWDSPDVRQSILDRVTDDGGVYLENRYGPRPMVIKGVAVCATGVDPSTLDDFIAGQMHTPTGKTLTVHEAAPKFTTVRRAGRYRSRRYPDHVEFEVDLVAADPRKYGTALKTAVATIVEGDNDDSAVLTNNGTIPAWPARILLEGGGAGPLNIGPLNQYISVFGGMTAGQRYVIYPYTADVLFGTSGSEVSANQNRVEPITWWTYGVGNTTVFFQRSSTTGGTLTATIEYRDAYV